MMSFADLSSSGRRSSSNSRCSTKAKRSETATLPTSPQTQFDLALTLLRHQLQQPTMTSSWSRGGGSMCDVTRSATESLLLAALGLAVPVVSPAASPTGQSAPQWVSVTSPPGCLTAEPRRYKTELCRAYEERGQCRYGDRCQFAHSIDELRAMQRHPKYKTELCRTYHTSGFCPYGARCHFVHNPASPPAAPPPTPRDPEPAGRHHARVPCRPVNDDGPLNLPTGALDENVSVLPANCAQQVSPSGNGLMTSTVVASILQRRRPKVTLTLDPPRTSPPSAVPTGGPSRRSSASMDSGYGSSPTFPPGVDMFSSPPPPLITVKPPPAPWLSNGPMTAPLLTRSLQSPADHGLYRRARHLDPPARSGYSQRAPPPLMETATTFKFDPYFVFDGFIARP